MIIKRIKKIARIKKKDDINKFCKKHMNYTAIAAFIDEGFHASYLGSFVFFFLVIFYVSKLIIFVVCFY